MMHADISEHEETFWLKSRECARVALVSFSWDSAYARESHQVRLGKFAVTPEVNVDSANNEKNDLNSDVREFFAAL